MLIAVGYLRMGPWEHTGMTVAAITRQQYLDDVTNHVGVSLLGQGLRCAACHDHKFDPVPTRDYYRMQAVFSPVQFVERPAPFLPSENIAGFESAKGAGGEADRAAQGIAASDCERKTATPWPRSWPKKASSRSTSCPPISGRSRITSAARSASPKTDLSLRKIHQKSLAYLEREMKRFEPYALSVYSGSPNDYTSIRPLYKLPQRRRAARFRSSTFCPAARWSRRPTK